MRKAGIAVLLFYSCLAQGSLSFGAIAHQKMNSGYDGHWWLSISLSERSGFLNGYFDCYSYEFMGPASFTKNPPDIARELITKYYEDNPAHLDDSVSAVFYSFRDRPGEKSLATDGEQIKGKHGFYDGTYWKQISALGAQAEQLGFVEGYLWCHVHLSRNQGGVFSKAPAEYVYLITRWYKFNKDTLDIDAKREPAKIADVLFKFRNNGGK